MTGYRYWSTSPTAHPSRAYEEPGSGDDVGLNPETTAVMCGLGSVLSGLAGLGALMGNKDKGGRNTKKQAARSLKQKRAEKKAKREAVKGKPKSGPF